MENKNIVIQHYGDGEKEDRRCASSYTEWLEFQIVKKIMKNYISQTDKILEIGCSTGEYGLYFASLCEEYVGVDLTPSHIDIFRKKIKKNDLKNVSCQVGNAEHLEGIADKSFDVVCCFGPMYHLPPKERELVFAECKRVCKDGGIISMTYRNKIGVYVGACVHDRYREMYPKEITNRYLLDMGTEDWRPNLFYFTMPEEIESVANKYELKKIRNSGINFLITSSVLEQMDNEKRTAFMKLVDKMVEYESCTGMSDNAILVCQKGIEKKILNSEGLLIKN